MRRRASAGELPDPYCNAVSPGYFTTIGIPLLAGRDFDSRDERFDSPQHPSSDGPPPYRVAIVNESWVRHYVGNRNPLGRHFGFGIDPGTTTPIEVIGVVKNAKYTGVRHDIPEQVFVPFLESDVPGGSVIYVRTAADSGSAYGSIRQAVREIDANVPVYNLRTLDHQIDQSHRNERIIATLSTAFGVLATVLAIIGLYGVMAYTVARRTREIGVRMALGALRRDVVWLVMREVLMLVGVGVLLGLAAALGASRLIGSQLYGIAANDPATIVAAVLAAAALAAGYLPARRATRVNPVLALRYE